MPPPDDHTDDGRLIALDGTTNTRDVGGYATRDGRIVRHGRLLRSAHLDALTGAGRARFAALPVATVVDFRGREEGAGAPDFTPARRLHVAIEPTIGAHLRRRRDA
ncbi:MAG: tyrosine-protein phosphatase, partial [Rhodospirillales bacterium]|nr:tyrosine-protein phosphatase [Rhodospirillales bacterium]